MSSIDRLKRTLNEATYIHEINNKSNGFDKYKGVVKKTKSGRQALVSKNGGELKIHRDTDSALVNAIRNKTIESIEGYELVETDLPVSILPKIKSPKLRLVSTKDLSGVTNVWKPTPDYSEEDTALVISDSQLTDLSALKSLRINLDKLEIYDSTIKKLNCGSLSCVELRLEGVKGLQSLRGMPDTEVLVLDGCPDLKSIVDGFVDYSSIDTLYVSGCPRIPSSEIEEVEGMGVDVNS